ncbi:MAG: serine/threonine protein kinase [Victivallales bacterium]|nr:serine/threonine protein kinase [Victivallales bacterium]
MSESGEDKKHTNSEADIERTAKMPFDPAGVELTQKIDVDHAKVTGGSDRGKAAAKTPVAEDKKPGETLLGTKSIFTRKRIADDFVRSSTILSSIHSIPPLEDDLQLLNITSNYELKDKFSEGSQGVIRTAFDKSLKRDVVVKSLKADDDIELARKDENLFVSEARIMAQLDHPSIIPLYGLHCGAGSKLHLAMKHIHGKTLQKYLQDIITLYAREGIENFDEKRSIATRIEYFIKVCEAVDYAHCKGVIHRDLKPENIMIGNYGEVYVMDWGLACLVNPEKFNDDKHITEIGMHAKNELVGTPCYLAPELIRGGECSPQSDIFSLGMILFDIVTLQRAVPGNTVNEVLKNIVDCNYRPFKHRFLKCKLPADLMAIIAKAICEPLSQRYRTAGEMAKDLKLYLRREETAARPDNLLRKCVRAMVNHKLVTSVVIMSILLCLAASTIYSLYAQNQLMREQKIREEMLTAFQHGVSRKAYEMERIFFYLKSQLADGAYDAGFMLSREPISGMGKWAYPGAYRDPATAPPDYRYLPSYGVKVSLDYSVLQKPGGIETADEEDKRIVAMAKIFKHVMFSCDPAFENKPVEKVREIITSEGAPLIFIFIGLKNGTMFSYPGKPYAADYDPRRRPWYHKGVANKGKIGWSEPYKCIITSKILICCTSAIYDEKKRFRGVIGMDVSLHYIQKQLFEGEDSVREYLLNQDGKIVLSSNFKDKNAKTGKHATMIMTKFPFLKEFRQALENGKVNFESATPGGKYIFGLTRLPSLGYYYIRQISEKKLSENWKNRNNPALPKPAVTGQSN